jgi:hypothetical protein
MVIARNEAILLTRVNGEHSLIMLVYNIKRAINIFTVPDLIAKLKNWKSPYKTKIVSIFKRTFLRLFNDLTVTNPSIAA